MSYRLDVDEYDVSDLRAELRTRAENRRRGLCDYCGRPGTTTPCKFPARHGAAKKLTAEQRMGALCESFPALRNAPGVSPWRPSALEEWTGVCSSGELHAVRFVLSVWNCTHAWSCGPFEVVRAMGVWDSGNRAAFQAWAEEPWTA